ncbi:unnamed protein product, partial [Brassicogethes aeneus]
DLKLLVLVGSLVYFLDALPVIIEIENFIDDWNYQIEPNSVPLLNSTGKRHVLPTTRVIINETHHIQKIKPRRSKAVGNVVKSKISCSSCKIGANLLLNEVNRGSEFEVIKQKFVGICSGLRLESTKVCTGVFDVYGPHVVPVLQTVKLEPLEICSLLLGEPCGDVSIPKHEWTVQLPETPKPDVTSSPIPEPGMPTFKVLHLSDTHFDPEYVAGSPANCEEPLCCRIDSTPSTKEAIIPAGLWGSYQKCDSPGNIITNMLKHIAQQHPDIDFIIWTGDLPPHDVWNTTRTGNLDIIKKMSQEMFDTFPNTPIFPALGNHESSPAGSFAPPWMKDETHGISWLYGQIQDQWKKWLPSSSENTLLHGGFYSVLLTPGFRLISLNNNYCHTLSWWLLVNSTDPASELTWLVYELEQAEIKGEKVHIIGHIPPGSSDCMKVWSKNYNVIVNRFENTIVAQYYGHSHADEFEVFYEMPKNSRATSVAYLGPSVTTYENYNPAYRIYYVDANDTREVMDHETWTFDLDEANRENSEPKWYRLYSAKSAYGMESLRASEWSKLIENMIENEDLFDYFYKNYYRDSPTKPGCDQDCKLQLLCDLRTGRSQSREELCHDLEYDFRL